MFSKSLTRGEACAKILFGKVGIPFRISASSATKWESFMCVVPPGESSPGRHFVLYHNYGIFSLRGIKHLLAVYFLCCI